LLVSLLICVVEYIDTDNALLKKTKKRESVLYYPLEKFAGVFLPAAKEMAVEFL